MALHNSYFSVNILDTSNSSDIPYRNGDFFLKNKQEYTVKLENGSRYYDADATIIIDGKTIGKFRVRANDLINIESSKGRRLTFYKYNSEAGHACLNPNNPRNGELKVIFDYALRKHQYVRDGGNDECDSVQSDGPACATKGATGLGRNSSQRFTTIPDIVPEDTVTIKAHLRLNEDQREDYISL